MARARILLVLLVTAGLFGAGRLFGQTFDVTSYGASPNTNASNDDSIGVQKAVDAAIRAGGGTVVFPAGVYDFLVGTQGGTVAIRSARNLTLEGRGSTVLMHGFDVTTDYSKMPYPNSFTCTDCTNLEIGGLRFDFARPPLSAGVVTDVDLAAGSFDVQVDREFPLPASAASVRAPVLLSFDSAGHATGEGFDYVLLGDHEYRISNPKPADPQRLRITGVSPWFRSGIRRSLQKGQRLVIGHAVYFGSRTIALVDCDGVRLKDITVWAGSGGLVGFGNSDVEMTRFVIERKPGTGRQVATLTDGVHMVHTKGRFRMQDCRIQNTSDDCINLLARFFRVRSFSSSGGVDTAIIEDTTPPSYAQFGAGDKIEFFQPDLARQASDWTVVSAQTNKPLPSQHTLVLRSTGAVVAPRTGDWACNVSRSPASEFRNCHFADTTRYGIMVHTRDTLIDGCTFAWTKSAAVAVCADVAFWMEGPTPRNIRMTRCTMTNVNYASRRAGGAISIQAMLPTGEAQIGALADIFIDNLTLSNTPRGAIDAIGVRNLSVRFSRFHAIATDPQWSAVPQFFVRARNTTAEITNSSLTGSLVRRVLHTGTGSLRLRYNSGF